MSAACTSCGSRALYQCHRCNSLFCGLDCFSHITTSLVHLTECTVHYQLISNEDKKQKRQDNSNVPDAKKRKSAASFPLQITINHYIIQPEEEYLDRIAGEMSIDVFLNDDDDDDTQVFSKQFIDDWGSMLSLYTINITYDSYREGKAIISLDEFYFMPKLVVNKPRMSVQDTMWFKNLGSALLCAMMRKLQSKSGLDDVGSTPVQAEVYNVMDNPGNEPIQWAVNQTLLMQYYNRLGFKAKIPYSDLGRELQVAATKVKMLSTVSQIIQRCTSDWEATLEQARESGYYIK